ncbi:trp operon repressor [Sansalvadorimonas sp. 2012CJ34-2]|uniref:Trp operon repressor homolog n=1 Tax=Parendozoicomonas callyspongiae TaxID=2942213 RepID=A0ABT0PCL3_9GAMM|nr:trp operon repressor [Sansalvadorimonas sp. 2012CJ34-2]MCL6268781.1 trp operon repressor [Sansalvadorimonas sp. 2012CJ34-2]
MTSSGWQFFLDLIEQVGNSEERSRLLEILMTHDERSAMAGRVEIIASLLAGEESQREMAARLGVSIATITRGSNNLKNLNDEDRALLNRLFDSAS